MNARSSSRMAGNSGCLSEELGSQAMDRKSVRRHVALGIDVAVKPAAGWNMVNGVRCMRSRQCDGLRFGSRPVVSVSRTISRISFSDVALE